MNITQTKPLMFRRQSMTRDGPVVYQTQKTANALPLRCGEQFDFMKRQRSLQATSKNKAEILSRIMGLSSYATLPIHWTVKITTVTTVLSCYSSQSACWWMPGDIPVVSSDVQSHGAGISMQGLASPALLSSRLHPSPWPRSNSHLQRSVLC